MIWAVVRGVVGVPVGGAHRLLVGGVGLFVVAELYVYHEPGWVAELARTMMVAAALVGLLGLAVILLDADADERRRRRQPARRPRQPPLHRGTARRPWAPLTGPGRSP